MSTKAGKSPTDLPVYAFTSATEFEEFLEREHTTAPGIHVKMAKKSSGLPTISGPEAVEVALCFGWIDGRANSIDDTWWMVRFTPRRAKSMWSQKNVSTVARLSEEGKMRPAGLAAVESAKADGRWERAYAGPATIQVPEDFAAALKTAEPTASAFFESLNRSDRYSVLWRVQTASPAARPNRIEAILQLLAAGKVPGSQDSSKSKAGDGKKSVNAREGKTNKVITKPQPTRRSKREGLRSRT